MNNWLKCYESFKKRFKETRYLWPYWAGALAFWILVIAATVYMLTGCSPILATGLEPNTMRTAIDECKQQNLHVLLYQRPDTSVFAIRCIPKEEDVHKTITVRPRVPMRVIRHLLEQDISVIMQSQMPSQ